jgi:hypothetical protein
MNTVSVALLWSLFFGQTTPQAPAPEGGRSQSPSAYFAFVDHDYIFTLEIVKPGVPLLNFVSMTEADIKLQAKHIGIELENRKTAATLFSIETADPKQPIVAAFLTIHPRSSFGFRLDGPFGDAGQFVGVTIRLGNEELKLAPMENYDFEVLVSKVNRLNLGSPDFREDWHVLKLERLGRRSPVRGR